MTKKINKKILFLFLLITGFLVSCDTQSTNNKILIQSSDFNIEVLMPDTLSKNDTIYTPIVLTNKLYDLRESLFKYNISDTTIVDTSTFMLVDRGVHLPVHGDTAQFWITTGQATGNFHSDEITLIARGPEKKLYYQTFSFDYHVK